MSISVVKVTLKDSSNGARVVCRRFGSGNWEVDGEAAEDPYGYGNPRYATNQKAAIALARSLLKAFAERVLRENLEQRERIEARR